MVHLIYDYLKYLNTFLKFVFLEIASDKPLYFNFITISFILGTFYPHINNKISEANENSTVCNRSNRILVSRLDTGRAYRITIKKMSDETLFVPSDEEIVYKKILVTCLSPETTKHDLLKHFQRYCEVEEIDLRTDRKTGKCRGYAFVLFRSIGNFDTLLKKKHVIRNYEVGVKMVKVQSGKSLECIAGDITDDDIRNFFNQMKSMIFWPRHNSAD